MRRHRERSDPTAGGFGHDPDRFEAFYREQLPTVSRFVARRVDDPYRAADLTADIFVHAIESADRYDAALGNPRTWLIGIARHVVATHYRSAAREQRALCRIDTRPMLDDDSHQRLIDRLDAERSVRQLYVAIGALPQGQRDVLECVVVDELSLTDTGLLLGITPASARVRLHRARQALQPLVRQQLSQVKP